MLAGHVTVTRWPSHVHEPLESSARAAAPGEDKLQVRVCACVFMGARALVVVCWCGMETMACGLMDEGSSEIRACGRRTWKGYLATLCPAAAHTCRIALVIRPVVCALLPVCGCASARLCVCSCLLLRLCVSVSLCLCVPACRLCRRVFLRLCVCASVSISVPLCLCLCLCLRMVRICFSLQCQYPLCTHSTQRLQQVGSYQFKVKKSEQRRERALCKLRRAEAQSNLAVQPREALVSEVIPTFSHVCKP